MDQASLWLGVAAFGVVNSRTDSTWTLHQRVPIRLAYQDLDGRNFLHELDLFIADASGFAASAWDRA